MAEFCRECFIKYLGPTQDEINRIIMSDDDDFCESCMNWRPYVLYIGDKE